MDGTDEAALVDEEISRRPVEAVAGVRADVQVGADLSAFAHQDQRLGDTVNRRLGFAGGAVGKVGERQQSRTCT